MKVLPVVLILASSAVLMVSYQQCSPVNFNGADGAVGSKAGNISPDPVVGGNEDPDGDPVTEPTGKCKDITKDNVEIVELDDRKIVRTACLSEGDSSCIVVCHVPPGNPAARHSIIIGESARKAHVGKHGGDYDGPCGELVPEKEVACEEK